MWATFWIHDLRFARAADTLLLVPVAGVIVWSLGGRFRHGLAGGLFLLWLFFLQRAAGVGCVGVSASYENMLTGTLIAYLVGGIHRLLRFEHE